MKSLTFEELQPGQVYDHDLRRTITEIDNVGLSCLTQNLQPLHIDADFASKSMWGRVLVDSMVTIGVIMGIHNLELTHSTASGNLRVKEVKFPNPVFHGDTLKARTTVLAKNGDTDIPGCGAVDYLLEGFNQSGVTIMSCTWTQFVHKATQ
ncbi:MaoC family dehydratase [Vineibacter terrae]|uniref:MaoC family dehydratase n=1 Tax=Vineibacter terrae TaxID=2586908 RepID=UPI002E35A284|nr:MaoC family dehydratase [Vineibacter terrae]HEX2891179.1 MaoC family dehydratase [Vineibacter terrae]